MTNDVALALRAQAAGIDQIGVDLERLGKAERQLGHDTRLSHHSTRDLASISAALGRASAFARLNPINSGSAREVGEAIDAGARVVMLPFFTSEGEVEEFVRLVDGRARVIILVETGAAILRLRQILGIPGISEVMVGLNDLRLQFGVASHFEVLASPLLEHVASEVRRAGLAFSVGGVARPDDLSLPIPPDLVLAQFPRLRATGAWVSRSFFNKMPIDWDPSDAVRQLRGRLTEWANADNVALEHARDQLGRCARRLQMVPV